MARSQVRSQVAPPRLAQRQVTQPLHSKRRRWGQLAVLAAVTATPLLAARPAQALLSFTGNGAGFAIPDNTPAGASSEINVVDAFLIGDITVNLNDLSHPFIGDLIATLTHVSSATTVTLFNRVGRVDSGTADASNFGATYRFNDAFSGDLWAAAGALPGSGVVPGGDYFPTGANSSSPQPILPSLLGLDASGTWRLTISDVDFVFTGSLGSWTLNLQEVPGPLPLLGAGAAFAWSRRLRRKLGVRP